MALKQAKGSKPEVQTETSPERERTHKIQPEVDKRLTEFMAVNERSTDYYRKLVNEDPEWAVRSLMLPRMLKHEREMKLVERQMPQVKQWVEKTPGMLERILEKIQNVNPFYREKAFVNEAKRAKMWDDFTPPRETTSSRISA